MRETFEVFVTAYLETGDRSVLAQLQDWCMENDTKEMLLDMYYDSGLRYMDLKNEYLITRGKVRHWGADKLLLKDVIKRIKRLKATTRIVTDLVNQLVPPEVSTDDTSEGNNNELPF